MWRKQARNKHIRISVTFWGTRGSIPTAFTQADQDAALEEALACAGPGDVGSPAAAKAFLARMRHKLPRRIGGETTCVEFQNAGGGRVIVDFGSGARRFGAAAIAAHGPVSDRPYSFLMTHMHWDHVQGFPFFAPAFIPGNRLRIGGGHGAAALEKALFDQFGGVYFPVPRQVAQADVEFFDAPTEGSFELEGFTITPFLLQHGGGSWGYRFDYDGASVVFASDAQHEAEDVNADYDYVKWAQGADALIFDAQYSFVDLVLHKGDWGHSSGLVAVDLAHLAKVKDVILTHHDPAGTDRMVQDIVVQTTEYEEMLRGGGAQHVRVRAAQDGMVFTLT